MATIGSEPEPPSPHSKPARTTTLKRKLEDQTTDDIATRSATEEAEFAPARKRRDTGQGQGREEKPRRSTRVTRSSTAGDVAVPQPQPAPRGRATKGKKGKRRS